MDKWMGKPEKEMMAYPEYVEAKRQGRSEEEARFRVGDPRVKKGSLISLLTGAVKGVLTHGIGKVTRDGKEGVLTKFLQDHTSSRGANGFIDYLKDENN